MFIMVKVISGDRIGKEGRLAIGCSAFVFDSKREKVLLLQRADDGRWAVPGGAMEAGESLSEACMREVFEETGLKVKVNRLLSVYTSPHRLLTYLDGNKLQAVNLHFEAEIVDGKLTVNHEAIEFGFFSFIETGELDMHGMDRMRVHDGFAGKVETIIYDDYDV
jgi:ADP-ribose pyrophosphatase YjhB (NUDIX family)